MNFNDYLKAGFQDMTPPGGPVPFNVDNFGLGKPVDWGMSGDQNRDLMATFAQTGLRAFTAVATGGTSEIAQAGGGQTVKVDNADKGGIQLNVDPTGAIAGGIGDMFLRIVIIILGFIFVAAGLYMFKPSAVNTVIEKVKAAPANAGAAST